MQCTPFILEICKFSSIHVMVGIENQTSFSNRKLMKYFPYIDTVKHGKLKPFLIKNCNYELKKKHSIYNI